DPGQRTARFQDDVTLEFSRRYNVFYILLSADAALESVTDPHSGEALSFSRTLRLGSIPFALYRVTAPQQEGDQRVVRFTWSFSPEQVTLVDPFVSPHFFYLGYPAVWHPHTPAEDFFD